MSFSCSPRLAGHEERLVTIMRELEFEDARLSKLGYVKGITNPYPERFEKTHEIAEMAVLEDGTPDVRTSGRIILMRKMGKLSFVTIGDICGKIQIAVKSNSVGEEAYEFFKKGFDIGDFIGVAGEMFTTQAGEKTILASEVHFLGKSLKPLPEKFHGITNVDAVIARDIWI